MKKYVYYFKFLKPNETTFLHGSVHLIADNIVIANRMFERLYCNEEGSCRPVEAYKPKLDVYSIVEMPELT